MLNDNTNNSNGCWYLCNYHVNSDAPIVCGLKRKIFNFDWISLVNVKRVQTIVFVTLNINIGISAIERLIATRCSSHDQFWSSWSILAMLTEWVVSYKICSWVRYRIWLLSHFKLSEFVSLLMHVIRKLQENDAGNSVHFLHLTFWW